MLMQVDARDTGSMSESGRSPRGGHSKPLQYSCLGFPGGASGKEPACQSRRQRDAGLIPGFAKNPGRGIGNPLQYSCLENPIDRGA